jgi:hypothetical protein
VAIETVSNWLGINNMEPEYRLASGWLSDAVNVDITATGAINTRSGYAKKRSGAYTSLFATSDEKMMLAAKADGLYMVNAGATTETKLWSFASPASVYFDEVNGEVFFSNGSDSGIVSAGGSVRQWRVLSPSVPALSIAGGALPAGTYAVLCTHRLDDGRESAASNPTSITAPTDGVSLVLTSIDVRSDADTLIYIAPADSTEYFHAGTISGSESGNSFSWSADPNTLGAACQTMGLDYLPFGCGPIAFSGGRMCAAQYIQSAHQSVIWMSEPLSFHLFNHSSGFFMVPGEVRNLFAVGSVLIVATDSEVYAYTHDDSIRRIADFGVPHGRTHATDGQIAHLWTNRGVASIAQDGSFSLLTKNHFSPVSGGIANVAVIEADGQKRFVAAIDSGGTAFNPQT